jgi:YidC/Oxa1 family membrane protein insertase
MDEQNKNLILATALSFFVILVWFLVFPPPEVEPQGEATGVTQSAEETTTTAPSADGVATAPQAADAGATDAPGATTTEPPQDDAPRIALETPTLTGAISLRGGRLDQLRLKNYRETLDPDSEIVTLLSPVGSDRPYYALFGWAPGQGLAPDQVPGANTIWDVESGDTLMPDSPITLVWDNGAGLTFRREMSIEASTRLFAGAKEWETIRTYQNDGDRRRNSSIPSTGAGSSS